MPEPAAPRRSSVLPNLALLGIPLLILALLEGALRLGGFGYPPGFFVRIPGREVWASNQKYGWRYFPKGDARTPVPAILAGDKPAGSVRIFVLGESAAMGDPVPAYGFSRILEVMLESRHPGRDFEVINTGMTAINSHVILPIAADCAGREPDLFVVYMGNNEVVGPFGAGTVLDAYRSSRSMIRAGIAVRATRSGQLLERLVEGLLPGKGAAPEWRGMETFMGNEVAAGDPRMEGVYGHFEANLRDILDVARRAGTPVVLSTVAVNLRDNPPFASLHREGLDAASRDRWDRLFQEGAGLEAAGRPEAALAPYREALGIDEGHAELHYRLARCLEASGRPAEAPEHFERSRDLDALRFRADARINGIIRSAAGAGALLVDAERAFAESPLSPNGVPGEALLFDHVHFTFEGNDLLARTVLEGVERILAPGRAGPPAGSPPAPGQVAEALAFTTWGRQTYAAQAARIVERPPFTAQADHGERIARLRRTERGLAAAAATPASQQEAMEAHRSALARSPADLLLRESFARLLAAAGDRAGSEEQWRDLLARLPGNVVYLEELGHVLLADNQPGGAEEAYREALRIWPGRALTHGNLALALEQQGRGGEALEEYREALRIDPALIAPRLNLAQALAEAGRMAEGLDELREAVRREPEHLAARMSLAGMLASAGRQDEAAEEYRKAIDLRPDLAEGRLRLARLLVSMQRVDQAAALLAEAAEADPGSIEAHLGLAAMRRSAGRIDEAILHYRDALRLDPGSAQALNGLAWSLATAGDRSLRNGAEALALANRLCERTGCRSPVFLATLAAARAEAGQIGGAMEAAQRALEMARTAGDERAVREIEAHLARYRTGKPL